MTFHLVRRAFSSQLKVDKQLLAKLRKDSGSPFSKCHNALSACNNDFTEALSWLEEQSRKEGWKKVEKVKGRQTSQGLVSAVVKDNIAALVEVSRVGRILFLLLLETAKHGDVTLMFLKANFPWYDGVLSSCYRCDVTSFFMRHVMPLSCRRHSTHSYKSRVH